MCYQQINIAYPANLYKCGEMILMITWLQRKVLVGKEFQYAITEEHDIREAINNLSSTNNNILTFIPWST